MLRNGFFATFLMALVFVAPGNVLAAPQAGPMGGHGPMDEYGPMGGPRHLEMRARLLRQEVGLDEATALKAEKILDEFAPQRRALQGTMRAHRQALDDLMASDSNDQKAYQKTLDAMMETRQALRDVRQREIEALRTVLTPKEQARLMTAVQGMHGRRGCRLGGTGAGEGKGGPCEHGARADGKGQPCCAHGPGHGAPCDHGQMEE